MRGCGLAGHRIHHANADERRGTSAGAEAAERYANSDVALPDDLEFWVNEGYETL